MSERLPAFQGLPKSGSYLRVGDKEGYFFAADEVHPKTMEGAGPRADHSIQTGWGHFFIVPQDRNVLTWLQRRLRPAAEYTDSTQVVRLMESLQTEGYPDETIDLRWRNGTWCNFTILAKPSTAKRRGRHHKMKMPEGKYADLEIG